MMQPQAIIDSLTGALDAVVAKPSWGETALFYNPGRKLPNGVYFCTLKERDGAHDRASALSRNGVFRLSIGVKPDTYARLFGARPGRPPKGGVVDTGHDFSARGRLMPHPVYAWMSWVCILSPSPAQFAEIYPLIVDAHAHAASRFRRRVP